MKPLLNDERIGAKQNQKVKSTRNFNGESEIKEIKIKRKKKIKKKIK